ncbi:MBL fold metallo-hydrolase [Tissierella sp. DSM 105185]|uniref:MBL fold metallo-hydrolase n=1 Tax=Tissierella pigra TaxID=2607614 RepID=A0A6N7Y0C6_9FIRM|nr:MBL fold metallo-hydrolase [Tissierella pigra]
MKFKTYASSSKGNFYTIDDGETKLLIECGLPYKEIVKSLDFDLNRVGGVILSHCHKDHSHSVLDISKAGIDIYTSTETIGSLGLSGHRFNAVKEGVKFNIGTWDILPFELNHDVHNLGFLLQNQSKEKFLFITDTFYCKYKFNDVLGMAIECNYIKETLDQNITDGYIDERMKPRLLQSHFSLENVKEFLKANDLSSCREIILLHLSSRNSDQGRMIREIEEVTGIRPKVASKGLELSLNRYPY